MEIRLRRMYLNGKEFWQVCKPDKIIVREGIEFYYIKDELGSHIIETSTGRRAGLPHHARSILTKKFNEMWRFKGRDGFVEVIEKYSKAPRLSILNDGEVL